MMFCRWYRLALTRQKGFDLVVEERINLLQEDVKLCYLEQAILHLNVPLGLGFCAYPEKFIREYPF